MLEEILGIARKGIITYATGIAILSSGCVAFTPISSGLIQPVYSQEIHIRGDVEYSRLSWQEAIKDVQTPMQAQNYLDAHFTLSREFSWYIPGIVSFGRKVETFRINHTKRIGRCLDYAVSAAALLSDNGYDPLMLEMSGDIGYHTVFLYRTIDGFGALGTTPLEPIYDDIESLVRGFEEYYDLNFSDYLILNLDDMYSNRQWVDGDMDLQLKIPRSGFISLEGQ